MDFSVGKEWENALLRDFLTKQLHLSRRCISSLKNNERGMCIGGEQVTVRAVLHEGDIISLALGDDECDIVPTDIPLDIIYEDEYLVAVNKPYGMPTIISHGHYEDTLANALAYRYRGRGFVMRAVNRLDRDTSGICIVAKTKMSASALCAQMEKREITKKYIAILDGNDILQGENKIIAPIRRKEGSTMLREVCTENGGEYAETHYRCVSTGKTLSAVVAEPKTGRTHQLRVHFSHIGHPIIGDSMYFTAREDISRQALHAFEMTFRHPVSGETMTLRAPVPEDIRRVMESDGILAVI